MEKKLANETNVDRLVSKRTHFRLFIEKLIPHMYIAWIKIQLISSGVKAKFSDKLKLKINERF